MSVLSVTIACLKPQELRARRPPERQWSTGASFSRRPSRGNSLISSAPGPRVSSINAASASASRSCVGVERKAAGSFLFLELGAARQVWLYTARNSPGVISSDTEPQACETFRRTLGDDSVENPHQQSSRKSPKSSRATRDSSISSLIGIMLAPDILHVSVLIGQDRCQSFLHL